MCVDGQRLVHLFASLAIFTSGKERLLEVESKTLLEGGQLASALISQTEQCTDRVGRTRGGKGVHQEQEELELYGICDIN